MKKLLIVAQFVMLIAFSSSSYALEGQGKIVEIQSCGSGLPASSWRNYFFFKLTDDNWFGLYGNHGTGDYDSNLNLNHSLLLTAFSMQLDVEVKATYSVITGCGITASIHYANSNDYLRIVRE